MPVLCRRCPPRGWPPRWRGDIDGISAISPEIPLPFGLRLSVSCIAHMAAIQARLRAFSGPARWPVAGCQRRSDGQRGTPGKDQNPGSPVPRWCLGSTVLPGWSGSRRRFSTARRCWIRLIGPICPRADPALRSSPGPGRSPQSGTHTASRHHARRRRNDPSGNCADRGASGCGPPLRGW